MAMDAGTWVSSRFWYTTEPVEIGARRFDRLRTFFGSPDIDFAGYPAIGITEARDQRSAERLHNAALDAGFESELSMIEMPGDLPRWTVTARPPGERSPIFWSEDPSSAS
jgi:hypothetical protein